MSQAPMQQEQPAICDLTLVIGGIEQRFTMRLAGDVAGDNVVEAALDAGIDVPYACLEGVCSTCRARVIEGQVEMNEALALSADDKASGLVLTCQSRPLTARVVLSYDDL